MSDRYIPKLGDYFINILAEPGITDTREQQISVHEFPFSQRNVLINTGKSTEEINFTCVFQDKPPVSQGQSSTFGIAPTFDNHFSFIELIDSGVRLEFVHPSYGSMDGYVRNYSTVRRDEQRYVEIEISYLREIIDVVTSFKYEIDQTTASEFRDSTVRKQNNLATTIKDNDTQAFKARLNNYIVKLNSFFSGVTSPIDSIVNTVDYLESQAGDVLSAVNGAVDRMVNGLISAASTPSSFINNLLANARSFRTTLLEPDGTPTLESILWNSMASTRINYESAVQYKLDDEQRKKSLINIDKRVFDDNGRYLGAKQNISVMTINELEQTSQDLREFTEEAIFNDRENRELNTQAQQIQQYVDEIKLQRDQIITVQTNTISLIELMKKYGISYHRVDENLALNPNVINPNFIEGEVRLLVPNE